MKFSLRSKVIKVERAELYPSNTDKKMSINKAKLYMIKFNEYYQSNSQRRLLKLN